MSASSAYGRLHGFDRLRSVTDFQDRTPLVTYEELQPFVDRIEDGESNVLTSDPVRMLERTSGSTSKGKLVPYGQKLLDDFSAATGPWLRSLGLFVPGLRGTTSYWSVSPAAREREWTRGGLPIGFSDDTEYFGPLERWAISRMLAVPGTVARISDVSEWRRQTLIHLVSDEHLGLISVWSPSFLTLLMRALEAELDGILARVPARRRADISRSLDRRGGISGEAIWPRLALISCWADGPAAAQLPALRTYFPGTPIQPKGLVATEGVVTFPLMRELPGRARSPSGLEPEDVRRREQASALGLLGVGGVVALLSHFFELIPLDERSKRPKLLGDVRVGARYSPVISTSGGFFRYRLMDAVKCVGHLGATPVLELEGRLDGGVDLVGEKLVPAEVDRALSAVLARHGSVELAVLVPVRADPARYTLVVDGDVDAGELAKDLDRALCDESYHYRYARELGQLQAVEPKLTRGALERLVRARMEQGARLGEIKPTGLLRQAEILFGKAGTEEEF